MILENHPAVVADAKYNSERNLIGEAKRNPRVFYSYDRSKTLFKETVTKVKQPNGSLTNSTEEQCDLLIHELKTIYQGT